MLDLFDQLVDHPYPYYRLQAVLQKAVDIDNSKMAVENAVSKDQRYVVRGFEVSRSFAATVRPELQKHGFIILEETVLNQRQPHYELVVKPLPALISTIYRSSYRQELFLDTDRFDKV